MANTDETITLEQVEQLAQRLASQQEDERHRFLRLIAAEARIVAIRDPARFKRAPREYGDEDGYWDTSYPPDQRYKDHSGPRLLPVHEVTTEYVATTAGGYYDARVTTTDGGLYIAEDGTLWECEAVGTATWGPFAAYPGWCNVRVELDYLPVEPEDVPLQRLADAEKALRAIAFPRATALAKAALKMSEAIREDS